MNQPALHQKQRLNYLLKTLWDYKVLWIAPAILGFVIATAYAFLLRPETWTARQSFTVRDDTLGQAFKPGRFESQESLQSAQETILEVARRPLVVRNVLEKLGPSSSWSGKNWITDELIEETQGDINLSAPNGAEFGTTEAIVLTAKASSRDRTRKFIELLSEELIAQVNRVRSLRLASMEAELKQAYEGAAESQQEAVSRLTELDERLTPEFGVINTFNNGQSQISPAELEIAEIKTELRRKKAEVEKAETILAALRRASESPEDADLSSSVLKELSSLDKMYDDLAKFRNDLAIAQGNFRDRYGPVQTLKYAIDIQQKEIRKELSSEISGVQADIAMYNKQIETKSNQIADLESRLIQLSKYRTEYLSLFAQVRELTDAALQAKTTWRKTKSLAESASSVGLLTPMDVAQVSSKPDGIGKKVLALAGVLGGLMVGVGLVLLVAPGIDPDPTNEHTSAPRPQLDPSSDPNTSRPTSGPVVAPNTYSDYSSPVTASLGATRPTAVPASPVQATVASQTPMTANSNAPAPPNTAAKVPSKKAEPVRQDKTRENALVESLKAKSPMQPSKARPVDLIKSAEKEDGFVQVKPAKETETASEVAAKTPPNQTTAGQATAAQSPVGQTQPSKPKSTPRKDNPFLRAIAKPEPSESDTETAVSSAQTPDQSKADTSVERSYESSDSALPDVPTAGNPETEGQNRVAPLTIPMPASALRASENTVQMDLAGSGNDDAAQGGIPEQIRKLTESIKRFGDSNPSGQ